MRNLWLVALRELRMNLLRRNFYLVTIGMPLLISVLYLGIGLISREAGVEDIQRDLLAASSKPTGLVDQSGTLANFPAAFGRVLQRFPDEAAAQAAINARQIEAYFLLRPDFATTRNVTRISRQASFLSADGQDNRALTALVRVNLIDDLPLALRFDQPATFDTEITAGGTLDQVRGQAPGATTGIATGFAFLLAFSLITGGNMLLGAISDEKASRTIEVLLTSLRPWQMLAGKMVGLGIVALIQLGIWLGMGATILRGVRSFLPLSSIGQVAGGGIPASLWGWAILFFLLGFLLYGALMATLAALGTSARESGQIGTFLTLPVLIPVWFLSILTERPNSPLTLFLSLFPFTSPTTLMLRLGSSTVPAWQLLVAILLLLVTIVGVLAFAARLFRASTLLTGIRLTPRTLVRAFRGG